MDPDDKQLVDITRQSFSDPDYSEMEKSAKTYGTESPNNLTEDSNESSKGHREKLAEILHSHKAQYVIVALVIVDMVIVIAELLLDLRAIEVHHESPIPHVLHYISIAILSIFLVELLLKIYAMGLTFFTHKLEVFDGIVVIVSFALDIAFSGHGGTIDGIGLIVLLRLWRVTRIVNGIVLSVQMQAERKHEHLEKENGELKKEIEDLKLKCSRFEKELQTLKAGSPEEEGGRI